KRVQQSPRRQSGRGRSKRQRRCRAPEGKLAAPNLEFAHVCSPAARAYETQARAPTPDRRHLLLDEGMDQLKRDGETCDCGRQPALTKDLALALQASSGRFEISAPHQELLLHVCKRTGQRVRILPIRPRLELVVHVRTLSVSGSAELAQRIAL